MSDKECLDVKKYKGFILMDSLFSFVIFTTIITLLYLSYIGLIQSYQISQKQTIDRLELWEEKEMY